MMRTKFVGGCSASPALCVSLKVQCCTDKRTIYDTRVCRVWFRILCYDAPSAFSDEAKSSGKNRHAQMDQQRRNGKSCSHCESVEHVSCAD